MERHSRRHSLATTPKGRSMAHKKCISEKPEWRKPWGNNLLAPGSMAMSLQLAGSWNSKFLPVLLSLSEFGASPVSAKPTTMKCLEKVLVFAEVQAFYPVRQAGKIWPPQNTAVSGRHLQIVAPLLQKAASRPNISSRTARSPNSSGEIFLPSSAMAKIRLPGPAKFCQHYRSMLNKLPENSLDLHL